MPRLNRKRSFSGMRQISDAEDAKSLDCRPLSAAPNLNAHNASETVASTVGQSSKQDSIKSMVRSFFRRRPTNESLGNRYEVRSNPNTRSSSRERPTTKFSASSLHSRHHSTIPTDPIPDGIMSPIEYSARFPLHALQSASVGQSAPTFFQPDPPLDTPWHPLHRFGYSKLYPPRAELCVASADTGLTPRPTSTRQRQPIPFAESDWTQNPSFDESTYSSNGHPEVIQPITTEQSSSDFFRHDESMDVAPISTELLSHFGSRERSLYASDSPKSAIRYDGEGGEHNNQRVMQSVVLEERFKDLEKRMRALERTVIRLYRYTRGANVADSKSVSPLIHGQGDNFSNITTSASRSSFSPEISDLGELSQPRLSYHRLGTFGGSSASLYSKSSSSPATFVSYPSPKLAGGVARAQLGEFPPVPLPPSTLLGEQARLLQQSPQQDRIGGQFDALAALVEKERIARRRMRAQIMSLQRELTALKAQPIETPSALGSSRTFHSDFPAAHGSKFGASDYGRQAYNDGFNDIHENAVRSNDESKGNVPEAPSNMSSGFSFPEDEDKHMTDGGLSAKGAARPVRLSRLTHPEGFI